MIVALDIETAKNAEMEHLLPEPEASKTLKDPAKIEADIEKKRITQREKMALDPMFARVISFAYCGVLAEGNAEAVSVADALTDDAERELLQGLIGVLALPDIRIATWNGIGFDLPMIYKRTLLLGVHPGDFDAPPLGAWTQRYKTDKHIDLMKVWSGWSNDFAKLDTVARAMLRGEDDAAKTDIDVTTFPVLMETEEGRNCIAEYNMQDARLTWRVFERMNGVLFK